MFEPMLASADHIEHFPELKEAWAVVFPLWNLTGPGDPGWEAGGKTVAIEGSRVVPLPA